MKRKNTMSTFDHGKRIFCFVCQSDNVFRETDSKEIVLPGHNTDETSDEVIVAFEKRVCGKCHEVKERRFDEEMARTLLFRYWATGDFKDQRQHLKGFRFMGVKQYDRDDQSRDFIAKNGYGNIPPS